MTMTWVTVKTTMLLDREVSNHATQLPTAIADVEKGSLSANGSVIQWSQSRREFSTNKVVNIHSEAYALWQKKKKKERKKIEHTLRPIKTAYSHWF